MYYTVTSASVHNHASKLLRDNLQLNDRGRLCTAAALINVLMVACARMCSLSAACAHLATAPCREAARKAWLAWIPARDELLRRLNRALSCELPRGIRRRPQQVAIDLVLIPYHGQPLRDPGEVYRSQAKSGTSHFHASATAYVNYRGQRYTLALTLVEKGEKMEAVLKRLFARLGVLRVSTRMVLLDRGFWSVGVIGYLQRARRPFLMPVVLRGRKADHAKGPSGTRVFALRKKGGWDEYTVKGAGGEARVSICVHCRNYNGQWGRHGRQALVYAFWSLEPGSTAWVRETYRKRFAIETSYRQAHQARARTCTRNPEMRLLLVGVALVLRNVWVWLHYNVLATPRRGNRRLNLELLPLKAMLGWLQHEVESLLGVRNSVSTELPLPQ